MGTRGWSAKEWTRYTRRTAHMDRTERFGARALDAGLDPRRMKGPREARDSAAHPESTPIIVAFDVTGSMGNVPDAFVRGGLGTMVEKIIERESIRDPHVCIMAVGDAPSRDRAPLQVTQFETDLTIVEALERIWLEGGGGGNRTESYDLAWYFAAMHTATDAWERRARKGFLFTVGDEEAPAGLARADVKRVLGDDIEVDLGPHDALAMAERRWEVMHVVVEEGSHARRYPREVRGTWREMLGQRVLPLADHTMLGETIVSAIDVLQGADRGASAAAWGGHTHRVVAGAVRDLVPAGAGAGIARI